MKFKVLKVYQNTKNENDVIIVVSNPKKIKIKDKVRISNKSFIC